MTIAKKISLICLLQVFLLVVTGLISALSSGSTIGTLNALATDSLPGAFTLSKASGFAKDLRGAVRNHITLEKAEAKQAAEADIEKNRVGLQASLDAYAKSVNDEADRAQFAKVESGARDFFSSVERAVSMSRAADPGAMDYFRSTTMDSYKKFNAAVDDLGKYNMDTANQRAASAISGLRTSRAITWFALFISVFGGGLLAWRTVHGIEYALSTAVDRFRDAANQVGNAAQQASKASTVLSQGASDYAAANTETSAACNEILSITERNAENSRSSAKVMGEVGQHIDEANSRLVEMQGSMRAIDESSQSISKIMKVIDEIAFQTNILALNAAVEAARAGEAGLGFAVVADEVRNLAQRCAQAARDTAGLIEESISRSHEGDTKLTTMTASIEAITASAKSVREMVDQVKVGSEEQARGVNEITRGVHQMERSTQQFAASAEETAAVSEELLAQVESMRGELFTIEAMVHAD
jgi:methyl-accepting chemotaxis protein/methyl-accepting chemotaxis protein-1 (serine sensor receptor)